MLRLIFTLLLSPLMSTAQEALDPKPSFENDTLYTTCGYKIYVGRTLQIGNGTGKKGKFRHITITNSIAYSSLANNSILVREIKNVKISPLDAGSVDLTGTIVFKDSSISTVLLQLNFDKAIENEPHLPSELIVPAEFRNSSRVMLHQKLNKLFKLYVSGALNKTDYEAQKKKLLSEQ